MADNRKAKRHNKKKKVYEDERIENGCTGSGYCLSDDGLWREERWQCMNPQGYGDADHDGICLQ